MGRWVGGEVGRWRDGEGRGRLKVEGEGGAISNSAPAMRAARLAGGSLPAPAALVWPRCLRRLDM